MSFVSAEKFLSLDEEIQKVFTNWWKPSEGDLYCTRWQYDILDVVIFTDGKNVHGLENDLLGSYSPINNNLIPLLKMDQLIAFIEEKKCHKMQIRIDEERYVIDLFKGLFIYKTDKSNILDALFEVACKIAKEKTLD